MFLNVLSETETEIKTEIICRPDQAKWYWSAELDAWQSHIDAGAT